MKRRPHPDFRPIDALLLLDKPRGASSNAVLQHARRLVGAERGGHTGALDPLATGMLPLCFGEATKIAGLLLAERKCYETVARFGAETDTCDADGQVVSRHAMPDLARLAEAIPRFTGRIVQVPPVYSSIRIDGERAYEKARRGEQVEVAAREVDVFAIDVLETGTFDDDVASPSDAPAHGAAFARLRIECGSGTYIRSIVRDLARALGSGAHVAELRRTWVEPFRDARMYTLEEIAQARAENCIEELLLPLETGLSRFPRVTLDDDQARRLGQGQSLPWSDAARVDVRGGMLAGHVASGEEFVAYDAAGRVLGFVTQRDGVLAPRRMFTWAVAKG